MRAMTGAAGDAQVDLAGRRVNALRRCYDCGYPIGRKARYCPRCGARQRPERIGANCRNHRE